VTLERWLVASRARGGDQVAVEEPSGRSLTYAELDDRATRVARDLVDRGIGPGDRVAFCLRKSLESVVSIFGILKSGAAYVPLDPLAPDDRNLFILEDAGAAALLTGAERAQSWAGRIAGKAPHLLAFGCASPPPSWPGDAAAADALVAPERDTPLPPEDPERVAYVLYTSGSTGKPKGVILTHRNAESFVRWCVEALPVGPEDRFSSHAPFHFDLSVLDLFVPVLLGATVVLIPEEVSKDPRRLSALVEEARLSVWYSTPSILTLLTQFGGLARRDARSLRVVLFAGEVFPLKHFRALRAAWPHPAYWNLYGPTETNVCTFHRVPDEIPPDRTGTFPIGLPCSHCRALVVDESLRPVSDGEVGELCIAGPSVFQGYWNLPDRTAAAFFRDGAGTRWYRTGDLVRRGEGGDLLFHGRRDRMVKRRGYRVELGEIEAALLRHRGLVEAAAVATSPGEGEVAITAFVARAGGADPSLVALKRHCAETLPSYMIPDRIVFAAPLPKTSTEKIDYPELARRAGGGAPDPSGASPR
jgi:amino acid adenylation domain-containing protein